MFETVFLAQCNSELPLRYWATTQSSSVVEPCWNSLPTITYAMSHRLKPKQQRTPKPHTVAELHTNVAGIMHECAHVEVTSPGQAVMCKYSC